MNKTPETLRETPETLRETRRHYGRRGDATGDAETQENFLERKFSRTLSKNFKVDYGSRGLDSGHFGRAETLTDF